MRRGSSAGTSSPAAGWYRPVRLRSLLGENPPEWQYGSAHPARMITLPLPACQTRRLIPGATFLPVLSPGRPTPGTHLGIRGRCSLLGSNDAADPSGHEPLAVPEVAVNSG